MTTHRYPDSSGTAAHPAPSDDAPRPSVTDVPAAQLWTGDLTDEGRVVFALNRFTRHTVTVTLVTMTADPDGDDVGPNRWEDRVIRADDVVRVARNAPLPDGSYMYRYDVDGTCHGVPGGGQPCLCGATHADP